MSDCKNNCQSCFMPLAKDPGKRESDIYCSYCFQNGKFVYEGDNIKEFQDLAYKGMRAKGMNIFLAKTFTFFIRFAPRWKKKKK